MKTIGYIRVSTDGQTVENQRLAIYEAGHSPNEWIEVVMSSRKTRADRRIDELLKRLSPGDKIVVSELSRLGRSIGQIVILVDEIRNAGVHLHCIKESLRVDAGDVPDMQTKVMVTMFGLFAEIERDLISSRTKEGLARARSNGKILGRPKGNGAHELDQHQIQIKEWLAAGLPISSIAKMLEASAGTVGYYIKTRGLK